MRLALVIGSLAMAIGWMPIGVMFWKSWRARRNPISLAICAMVALAIYSNAATILIFEVKPEIAVLTFRGLGLLILVNFHWAIRIASERFVDPRRDR